MEVRSFVHNTLLKFTNLTIVNIMAFYAATLFTDAKASERSALFFSWGFGLINFMQVTTEVARTYHQSGLHHIAVPGQRFQQLIPSGAVLCCLSPSPIWPGLCWPPHSASRYQPRAPPICPYSRFSSTFSQPSIRLVRVQYPLPIPPKRFLSSIAV